LGCDDQLTFFLLDYHRFFSLSWFLIFGVLATIRGCLLFFEKKKGKMIRAFVSQVPRAVRLNTTGAAAAGGTPRVVRSMKHSTRNIVSDDLISF
jgi:hypothetical protein